MRILPFDDALAPVFQAIGTAWIEAMFELEPHDREVLADPRGAIVDPGGVVLFVADEENEGGKEAILGTGALMRTAPGCVELTKMGVVPASQGRGVGGLLLGALIDRARDLPDVDTLYLLTSARCAGAIRLYERAGFVHDTEIMARFGGDYARCDVAMRFPL